MRTDHRGPSRHILTAMPIRDDRRLKALTAIAVVSLLALLVLAAVFIVTSNSTKADAPGFRAATEYPGGHVPAPTMRLEDAASGRPFDTASLAGRPYMGKDVDVVALSVDPRGDTRSAVQAWLKLHREPANFHYLIGSEAELQPYWEAWHVGPQIVGDPDSSHTAVIYPVTREGKIAAIIDAGGQVPSSDLAYDFRSLIGV